MNILLFPHRSAMPALSSVKFVGQHRPVSESSLLFHRVASWSHQANGRYEFHFPLRTQNHWDWAVGMQDLMIPFPLLCVYLLVSITKTYTNNCILAECRMLCCVALLTRPCYFGHQIFVFPPSSSKRPSSHPSSILLSTHTQGLTHWKRLLTASGRAGCPQAFVHDCLQQGCDPTGPWLSWLTLPLQWSPWEWEGYHISVSPQWSKRQLSDA